MAKVSADEDEARIAGHAGARVHGRVDVEGRELPTRAEPLEDRARVTARAEGRVDVRAAGAQRQRIQRFL